MKVGKNQVSLNLLAAASIKKVMYTIAICHAKQGYQILNESYMHNTRPHGDLKNGGIIASIFLFTQTFTLHMA